MVDHSSVHKKRTKILVGFVLITCGATFTAGGAAAYSLLQSLPDPERITELSVAESTKIYDRTGTVLLYEIHGEEKRTVLPLAEIPDVVKRATIVAEDIHFYQHGGLEWRGIARAFFKNLASGDIRQGGSTITQQLIKNSVLTGERTYTRKLKEALLAILLEKKYSKDEILSLYLNQIPYGSNAYGVAAAAETYFRKSVHDLTLEEAAILAALPKAPTYYSPFGNHKEELAARKDWILERMAEEEFASREDVARAKSASPSLILPTTSIRAPHFVMYVREYLNEKYGEGFVERGGLRVTTTLDWKLQEKAEQIVREGAEKNQKLVGAKNAALVALDPRSGDILSMVGSKDYFDLRNDGNVNVATRPRQPGSAFKPFVYATALKKGYTPETVLFDVPTEFNVRCNADGTPGPFVKNPKDCYHPQNYDEQFRGPVILRQALAQSLNVPSVKLLYLAGVKDSIATAKEFGITTLADPSRYGLTLVLGGAEVTLLEMTSAFGALAQEGILRPKAAILRIENARGVALEEKKEQTIPVLDTEIARTLNDILSDNDARVPVFSPQSSLYFPNRPVAAKTGTTQDFRDAWTIGYTASLVAGVWVGNNDNTPMQQGGISVMVAAPIWHNFMEAALGSTPPEPFTPPPPSVQTKPILRGIYRSGEIVKIDKISRKRASDFTPPELIEEVGFGEIRSILTLIEKDDPLGNPPTSPDPQLQNWQEGINRWLHANPLISPQPPHEVDDLHTWEKRPSISLSGVGEWEVPREKGTLHEIRATVNTTFPLQEISLFINDALVASKTAPILSPTVVFSLPAPLAQGAWKIVITAYDAVGNKGVYEREINIK